MAFNNTWSRPTRQNPPRGMPVQGGFDTRNQQNLEEDAAAARMGDSGGQVSEMPELVAQLLEQKKAGAEITGMDDQLLRAAKLRDQKYNEGGEFTTGGIGAAMGAMANLLDRNRGQKEHAGLTKVMNAAREKLAEGEAAMEARGIQREDRAEQRQVEAVDYRKDRDRAGDRERALTRSIAAKNLQQRQLIDAKNEAYRRQEKASLPGGGAGNVAAKSRTKADRTESDRIATAAGTSKMLSERVSDAASQIGGMPTGIVQTGMKFLARHDLLDKLFFDEDTVADATQQVRFESDWQGLIDMPIRHSMYGANLTANETRLYNTAKGMQPGMDPALFKERAIHLAMMYQKKAFEHFDVVASEFDTPKTQHNFRAIGKQAQQAGLELDEQGYPIRPMSEEQYEQIFDEYYGGRRRTGRGGKVIAGTESAADLPGIIPSVKHTRESLEALRDSDPEAFAKLMMGG